MTLALGLVAPAVQSAPPTALALRATVQGVWPTRVELSVALGTAFVNAASKCDVEYGATQAYSNLRAMQPAPTAFTQTLVALPPNSRIHYRVRCDGIPGPDAVVTTLPTAAPRPARPTISAAGVTGQKAQFSFLTDPTEPTVYWFEVKEAKGWHPFAEKTTTVSTGSLAISTSQITIRFGVRNSAGAAHSPPLWIP